MSYICPACDYDLESNEDFDEFEDEANGPITEYAIWDNDSESKEGIRSDVCCPECCFTGVEAIFEPNKLFEVYYKEGKYYLPFQLELGIVTTNDLYFDSTALGELHYKVSIIRCITSISELPVFLTDNDSVVRNEAKKRFQKLGGK